jgi:hypothetical protein
MKRYFTALLFCTLSLTSQLARADIIDDAIGNIQQAINDAYNPGDSRSDDDDRYDDGRYQGAASRAPIASGSMTIGSDSWTIAAASLTNASASSIRIVVSWKATSVGWMIATDAFRRVTRRSPLNPARFPCRHSPLQTPSAAGYPSSRSNWWLIWVRITRGQPMTWLMARTVFRSQWLRGGCARGSWLQSMIIACGWLFSKNFSVFSGSPAVSESQATRLWADSSR